MLVSPFAPDDSGNKHMTSGNCIGQKYFVWQKRAHVLHITEDTCVCMCVHVHVSSPPSLTWIITRNYRLLYFANPSSTLYGQNEHPKM